MRLGQEVSSYDNCGHDNDHGCQFDIGRLDDSRHHGVVRKCKHDCDNGRINVIDRRHRLHDGGDNTVDSAEQPQSGGTLTIALGYAIPGFDPAHIFANGALDSTPAAAVFDSLIRVGDDGTIIPRLATSLTTSDNTTWTMKLRTGVTFTDGTPFNAAAVKFNWDREADPATAASGASAAKQITSSTVVDDSTLMFTLAAPNARFVDLLQDQLGMIGSPTAIQAEGKDFATKPVGAGPFTLTQYVPDSLTELTKNPNFWDAPRPYLDKVDFTVVADTTQRLNSLKTGGVNATFYTAPTGEMQQLQDAGFAVVNQQLMGGGGFLLNLKTAGLDDIRVRQALQMALNESEIRQLSADGVGDPVDSMFPKNSRWYSSDGGAPLAYDATKAQSLIDAYVAEKGGPVKLKLEYSENRALQAQAAMQEWSKIKGLEIDPVSVDSVTRDIVAHNYDIVVGSFVGPDPYGLFAERLVTGASQNYGSWSNATVDADVAKAKTSTSDDDLRKLYAEISQQVFNEVPYIFLDRAPYAYYFDKSVQGATQYHYAILDLPAIWLKK